jgi:hypothetical protein
MTQSVSSLKGEEANILRQAMKITKNACDFPAGPGEKK